MTPCERLSRRMMVAGLVPVFLVPFLGTAQAQPTTRTFNLVNNCGETIWVGSEGIPQPAPPAPAAQTGWTLDPSPACTSNSQCSGGQTCNTQAGRCQLVLTMPLSLSRLWPMTDCPATWGAGTTNLCPISNVNNLSINCCATGGCPTNPTGTAIYGLNCQQGGQPPYAVAEFTLGATDYYDVSMVDGFNVPVEMAPASTPPCPSTFPDCNYWCGNPGGATSTTSLQGCPWTFDASCNGNPVLRVVNPVSCASTSCGGSSTCNAGTNTCQCLQDSDCATGQLCGVGNNRIIGYRVCGSFAGCTTPKDLCGIDAYFAHRTGGEPCTPPGPGVPQPCASGTCALGKDGQYRCAPSPADALDCNRRHRTTVGCTQGSECPVLVGTQFASLAACDCPRLTTCVPQSGPTPGTVVYKCQQVCRDGQCEGPPCQTDEHCLATINGTNMLCDTTAGSPTFQRCVSTNTSLFETTGVNGVSCYGQPPPSTRPPSAPSPPPPPPPITTLCGGCPSGAPWPALPTNWECVSNNPDWVSVAQSWAAIFKQACPTAYSFPFDDPTSSFQCSSGTTNTMGYTITFCQPSPPALKAKRR